MKEGSKDNSILYAQEHEIKEDDVLSEVRLCVKGEWPTEDNLHTDTKHSCSG